MLWKQRSAPVEEILCFQAVIGAPEEIRTPDPQIRSLVLYPAELRAPIAKPGEKAWIPPAVRDSYRLRSELARLGNQRPRTALSPALVLGGTQEVLIHLRPSPRTRPYSLPT